MKHQRLVFWGIFFIFFSRSWADPGAWVRVGLGDSFQSVTIGAGVYWVSGVQSRKAVWKTPVVFKADKTGLITGPDRWGDSVVLTPIHPQNFIVVGTHRYRGNIELHRTGGSLRVVNGVTVEDYVRGVLQKETSDQWPLEALKAQAVISRTYGLVNRGRHGAGGYDLCAQTHCQVYGGASFERPAIDQAVRKTRGQVLVNRDKKMVSTLFHSSCGGETASADEVWVNGGQAHLRSVKCRWCSGNPRDHWTATVSFSRIEKNLIRSGHRIGSLRSVKVLGRTASGRADQIRLRGEEGTVYMTSNAFRVMVDPRLIRSTRWTRFKSNRDSLEIIGRGYGHGVGLCQWGMKAQADHGRSYRDILKFYYHGVSLREVTE